MSCQALSYCSAEKICFPSSKIPTQRLSYSSVLGWHVNYTKIRHFQPAFNGKRGRWTTLIGSLNTTKIPARQKSRPISITVLDKDSTHSNIDRKCFSHKGFVSYIKCILDKSCGVRDSGLHLHIHIGLFLFTFFVFSKKC